MNSDLGFTADKIFQMVGLEFDNYIFTYINCSLLPGFANAKEEERTQRQGSTPEKKKIICCPLNGPLNYPLTASVAVTPTLTPQ